MRRLRLLLLLAAISVTLVAQLGAARAGRYDVAAAVSWSTLFAAGWLCDELLEGW